MWRDLEGQVKAIYKEAIEISYFSRSSIDWNTVLEMTRIEKDQWGEFLHAHIEKEIKKKNPNY